MSATIANKQRAGTLLAALLLIVVVTAVSGCSGQSSTTSSSATAASAASTTEQATAASASAWVTVDVQQARDRLNSDKGAQIVDVREPDEWATTGVVPGAVLISLGQLEQLAPGKLTKDKPVYVICNSGNRSRTGSDVLVKLGYAEVYNVAGGIQAWIKAGLPVDSYTQ